MHLGTQIMAAPNMHAEIFWQEIPVSRATELHRYNILLKKELGYNTD
jgi:hypothetical protein